VKTLNINVFGTKYKVKKADLSHATAYGIVCKEKKIILIDNSINQDDFNATLIHELGHAMFKETGLNQTSIDSDLEEIIVENFSKIVCEVFNVKLKNKCI